MPERLTDMMYETDDTLMHYGVKGQKWGIRRYQNEDGSLTAEGKDHYGVSKKPSKFQKAMASIRKNAGKAASNIGKRVAKAADNKMDEIDPSRMSDQELREKINRLSMEKQYKQILNERKRGYQGNQNGNQSGGNQKKGNSRVKQIVSTVLIASATTVVASIAKKQLQVKSDEILAPRRKARRERSNSSIYLDPAMEAFTYFVGKDKKKDKKKDKGDD